MDNINTKALATCLGAPLAYVASRLVVVRMIKGVLASLHSLELSPVHLAVLAGCSILCLFLNRHSRASQAATSLSFRIFSSLMVRPYFKAVPWGREVGDWLPWVLRSLGRSPSATPSPPSSVAGSETSSWSGKDISSFRIPDRKLQARTRSSFGTHPQQQRRLLHQQQQRTAGPYRRGPGSNSYGQETPLATRSKSLPCTPKSPLTFTLGGRPRQQRPGRIGPLPEQRYESSGAATPTKTAASISVDFSQSLDAQKRGPTSHDIKLNIDYTSASGDLIMDAPMDQQQGCILPVGEDPLSPSWSSQASASLTVLTAKVDALLRPLVPTTPSFEQLKQWPSSGAAWAFRQSSFTEGASENTAVGIGDDDETSCVTSACIHEPSLGHAQTVRRTSLDGACNGASSSRHYTHGEISAHPSRRTALERFACSARMAAADAALGHGQEDSQGHSALASLGLDGDCPASIRALVTDEHLIQFGAMLGESSSEAAQQSLGIAHGCSEYGSLCGAADNPDAAWEPLNTEHRPGLRLRAWRLPLRKGYYVYKTVVEIDGVEPSDIRPFHLDDQARALWDDGAIAVHRAIPPGCTRASRHSESCMHSYISKFPRPMAPRRYDYARRVWHRPADGGCYAICQSCDVSEVVQGPKAVPVLEFTSAAVVKAIPGGSQVATLYFEDSQVRPGLAKVGVPKGLWPFWTKYEAALRLFSVARAATHRHAHDADHSMLSMDDIADNGSSSDGEGSDDELYGALAELKAARRSRAGGPLGASSRWARRLVIAGALKMMHVMLATK